MKKIFILTLISLLTAQAKSQYSISGTVRSTGDLQALYGATIKSADGSIHKTDKAGHFQFDFAALPLNLLISHLGYQSKQVNILTKPNIMLTILLGEENNQLKEVIISTGYQSIQKERATGSFQLLDQKTLNEQVGTHILDRLEAVANSVITDRNTSGSGNRLMIRGLSTIQGPKEPLIILDNFPYEGDPKNINPNDVENITILKDAAAASIWGTRAGNGVIVITTKKGKRNQLFNLEFNSNVTVNQKPNLGYLPQMTSSDFINVERYLFGKGYYDSDINSPSKPTLSPVVELLLQQRSATAEQGAAIDRQIENMKIIDVRNDFEKYYYQNSLNEQYSLNMREGTDKMTWGISTAYDRNKSILNDKYDRLNLKLQHSYKLIKNLEFSASLGFTKSKDDMGRPGYGAITSAENALYPYAQFADQQGNPLVIPKDWRLSYIQNLENPTLEDWQYYPLTDDSHTSNRNLIVDVLINGGITYSLPIGFSTDIKYQFERQQNSITDLQGAQSYLARNLVNSYSQISPNNDIIYKVPPGGILDLTENLLQSNSVRGQLNFNHVWNRHSLNMLAGTEIREQKSAASYNRMYGYNDELSTSGLVDYTSPYPNIISGINSYIPNRSGVNELLNRYVSLFSNAAYSYDSKYTLSMSARRDASNLFGLSTNEKWKPLWSAGISWDLSKEVFFRSKLIPYLKIRATYGISGNIDPSKSAVTTIQYSGLISKYTMMPYSSFSKYANPDLRWENIAMLNLGVDFSTKNDRISASIEYYHKKGTDLFGNTPLDYTAGIGSYIIKNVAAMQGSGWDLELSTLNIKGDFSWRSNLNLSISKNKVTKYYLNNLQGSFFLNSSNNISGIIGKPVYSIYAYRWAGLNSQTGSPQGYLDNKISQDYDQITGSGTQIQDLRYFGSAIPTLFGSFGNTINYKNLSVTFRLTYKFGYYFRRETINYPNLFSSWQGHKDFAKRWQQPGDEKTTNIPAFTYPFSTQMQALYTFSDPLIEKGDHIRLNYINLQYELSQQQLKKAPLKSLKIFLNLSNLGLLWKANKSDLDPDYISSTALPLHKTYTIGLSTTF